MGPQPLAADRVALGEIGAQKLEIGVGNVAARQAAPRRPRAPSAREERREAVERLLGELAVGGDLAAEHGERAARGRPAALSGSTSKT